MPTDFPGGVDDIQNDIDNSTLVIDLHPELHNTLADAVMAIETEVLDLQARVEALEAARGVT